MRIKYHRFLDRRQLISLFFAVFSGWMTAELIRRDDGNAWWVLWGILTLFMTAMALALPCLYLMTPKGLHIIHTFGLIRRFIPWDSVDGLEIHYDHNYSRRSLPYIFDTFAVYGDAQGPDFFFTEDEMVRTLRARLLLEKYTGLKVEGFLWQDIRDARKNRKEKKERERRRGQRQERVDRNRRAREAEKQSRKASKGKKN